MTSNEQRAALQCKIELHPLCLDGFIRAAECQPYELKGLDGLEVATMSVKIVQQLADFLRAEGALVLRLVGRQRFANQPDWVPVN